MKNVTWILLCVSTVALADAPPVNPNLENERKNSSLRSGQPLISEILADGKLVWSSANPAAAWTIQPGQTLSLRGSGFGAGPDVDFSKIMIGKGRALERGLNMYQAKFDLIQKKFWETTQVWDTWPSDIAAWSDSAIDFRVPSTVTAGPGSLQIQVQKRPDHNLSLSSPGEPMGVWDPLTERIMYGDANYPRQSDAISVLGAAKPSNEVSVNVANPGFAALVAQGEKIYWSYDYNIGMTHWLSNLDWSKIMAKKAVDPVTGEQADPVKLFGAIPVSEGDVPASARAKVHFNPFPMPTPLQPILGGKAITKGSTYPTGYVGLVYAEATNPVTANTEHHIGFNCAFCHAQLVDFEASPGVRVKKIIPGLPNPNWSLKWSVLSNMDGVKGNEPDIDGKVKNIDKTNLIYATPNGTAEHALIRSSGEKNTRYADDNLYAPIAIPIITRHLPVRRALSRTEMVAGFQGSYAHAEEPDGALGAMRSSDLQALTAYMSTLDANDVTLGRVGLHRTLKRKGLLALVDGAREGAFVQNGESAYPKLVSRLAHGASVYQKSCVSCHASNFGTNTDENMLPLTQVGTYFSPTIYNRETQSIRTAMVRNLYWVAKRGLLHDGHVRSVEDLVNPDRMNPNSDLYKKMYTLNPNGFKVLKGNAAQEQATRNHLYFVDVPWTKDYLYWDYQKMRREFGPRELGTKVAVELPVAPHPWPVESADQIDDLTLYLMTL